MKLIVAGPTVAVEHDGGTFRPEQRARIQSVADGIRALGSEVEVIYPPTRKAELVDLTRVHSAAYLTSLKRSAPRAGATSIRTPLLVRTRGMRRDVRQEPDWQPSQR